MNWESMLEQYEYLLDASRVLKCKPGEVVAKIDNLTSKIEQIDIEKERITIKNVVWQYAKTIKHYDARY